MASFNVSILFKTPPPSLIPEITKTYSSISSLGEKSANSRHDLLEILNSIDISSQNPNNKLVVDTLRSELRSINSRSEAQNLGDMVTKILYEYGESTGIDVIPYIIQAANNNTQASLSYVNNAFKLTLLENKKFGGVLKSMLTLNEAIIDVKEG